MFFEFFEFCNWKNFFLIQSALNYWIYYRIIFLIFYKGANDILKPHVSHFISHALHITCHTSYFTSHASHLTLHTTFHILCFISYTLRALMSRTVVSRIWSYVLCVTCNHVQHIVIFNFILYITHDPSRVTMYHRIITSCLRTAIS